MKIRIGGQAVTDGVMMRSDNYLSTAVRTPNGKIKVRSRKYKSLTEKNWFLGLPFIRGMILLVEMMIMGLKETTWASNINLKKEDKLSKKEMILAVVFALVIVLLIFKLLPWFMANIFSKAIGVGGIGLNIMDAALKIIILVIYFIILGRSKEIRNLFSYHGAEHKSVACYEARKKLTPENASKFSRIHPRCGTTFIFIVFIVGILFYVFIPPKAGFWLNYLIRILLLPIIAGVAYEIIRLGGRFYETSVVVRVIMWPGLQFQRLTTKEPNKKQLEVAIAVLNACIQKEKRNGAKE